MNCEKYGDATFKSFAIDYPDIAEKVIDWRPNTVREIVMLLSDGRYAMYDLYNSKFRYLGTKLKWIEDYTEQEWRSIFSDRLDRCLRTCGYAVEDVAYEIGISSAAIYKYLSCERTPTTYILIRMARLFNCTVDELSSEVLPENIAYFEKYIHN